MIRWLLQLTCEHEWIRLTNRATGRLALICMHCQAETKGIYTGPDLAHEEN